ncbi:MAG: 2TM domain-containing protein [Hyphomicrobiales bacterium]|nr:2TM domain-containing protein [Hyphomicrobiales bacterium]
MSGFPSHIERDWARALHIMQRTYPWHRNAFIGLNILLTVLNVMTGPPWWGLWPLLITGLLFMLHFLVYKASVIDDAWVDERAADVHYKSYDQGHIDFIAERHDIDNVNDRLISEGRESRRREHDAE